MSGQRNQQTRRRPGKVEEEPHPVGQSLLAQQPAERDHVVIVYPDEIIGINMRRDDPREGFVDALVPALEGALELGQVEAVMEQRPQGAVGITVVIFLDILLRMVDSARGHEAIGLEMGLMPRTRFARTTQPNTIALQATL